MNSVKSKSGIKKKNETWRKTLFARREPTTDSYAAEHNLKGKLDVVLYRDAEGTKKACVFSWHLSNKPKKSRTTCMFNCFQWTLQWLPDAPRNQGITQ